MYLDLAVLRDALIFVAKQYNIDLPYNAVMTDNSWNWNKEAIWDALSLIDYVRLTGKLPDCTKY